MRLVLFLILALLLLLLGRRIIKSSSMPKLPVVVNQRVPLWPRSYAYVLQAEKLASSREEVVARLSAADADVIVLDALFQKDERWRPDELSAMRAAHAKRRVFCYLSIGEAETYRPYWKTEWDADKDGNPDKDAAPFIDRENPDWPGNYKVKYWHPSWQSIILAEVETVMAQGFDGIWLDIVDAFEYYEADGDAYVDNRINPDTQQSYRADMVAWVQRIADAARAKTPTCWIVPQNGSQLLVDPAYARTISAVALESVFTTQTAQQPASHVKYIRSFVDPFMKTGKPVFLTEYSGTEGLRTYGRARAEACGWVYLLAPRALDRLLPLPPSMENGEDGSSASTASEVSSSSEGTSDPSVLQ